MIRQPDKTCALVVGIEKYGLGDDWDLPGAKIGADLFVEWLKRSGIDRSRIYTRPNACVDDIRAALDTLKQERQDCECLLFYWAGHGFETEEDDRSVFLADATGIAPKVFKLDAIVSYLRNETPQFTTQLGIIDACATGRRSTQAIFEPIHMTRQLPVGPPDFHFVLSASSGQETDYPDDGQPSLFTRRLLTLLDAKDFTFADLIRELKKDYPVFERDGRARYWSGSPVEFDMRELEKEVYRIGVTLDLDDAKWRAEARRLDAGIDMPNADFRAIVEKISGWEPDLARRICTALLLRGAVVARRDLRDAIQGSARLEPSYEAAKSMVDNLRAFENPCYLITAAWGANDELGATGVWFLSGEEKCEPQRLLESASVAPFDEAIGAAANHMEENDISSQSVIRLVVPLNSLLEPPRNILENECYYPLVFSERNRALGLEWFRNQRPRFRDRLLAVKKRAAGNFKLEWFETTDEEQWTSVEFPAVRTGKCPDAERTLETLLRTLTPFAAITRRSIGTLAVVDETQLAAAIGSGSQFAGIPASVHRSRNRAGSILPYLTIIWDDRELPRGYFQKVTA